MSRAYIFLDQSCREPMVRYWIRNPQGKALHNVGGAFYWLDPDWNGMLDCTKFKSKQDAETFLLQHTGAYPATIASMQLVIEENEYEHPLEAPAARRRR